VTVAWTSCVPGSTGVSGLALWATARSYIGTGSAAKPSTIRVTRPSEAFDSAASAWAFVRASATAARSALR